MSQESLVFLLALVVFLTPFLGIPYEWKHWIFVSTGGLLLVLGYRIRRAAYLRTLRTDMHEMRGDAFVENITARTRDIS